MKTKKLQVKVSQLKLCGLSKHPSVNGDKEPIVAIRMKWKGPPNSALLKLPFYGKSALQNNRTASMPLHKESIEWDDEFQSICEFPVTSSGDVSTGSWLTNFYVLYGESSKTKAKMEGIGKVSLNLAEMVSNQQSQKKLSITFNERGHGIIMSRQATLLICVKFAEIRNSKESARIAIDSDENRFLRKMMGFASFRKREKERNGQNYHSLSNSASFDSHPSLPESSGIPSSAARSEGTSGMSSSASSWKKTRLSLKRSSSWTKVEPLIENTCVRLDDEQVNRSLTVECSTAGGPNLSEEERISRADGKCISGKWERKEIISRDGEAKLKTSVLMGSFDQRSEKAGGEGACTALVAVITHWLHSNSDAMPTSSQFDDLIIEGSLEWQKLCSNDACINSFPDKHFYLETVLEANVRPLAILPEKSFVGFFCPEKFDILKEAMSFEQIWTAINSKTEDECHYPRIYIVSWNDHFFVLKVEEDAYYVIDSLGERLFEGCNQAYMLKFDESSSMYGKTVEEDEEEGEVAEMKGMICSGKECCREYIRRFLAAIPLRNVEEEESKGTSSRLSLHNRLQIDFHYSICKDHLSLSLPPVSNSFEGDAGPPHRLS